MSAGHSAIDDVARERLVAEQATYAAQTAAQMHARYLEAADREDRLAAMLEPLREQGFHILQDRLRPGSTRSTVDLVVVGPSGVIIVDTSTWGDVDFADNKAFWGTTDVTDRYVTLRDLADATQLSLAEIGMAPGEIRVVAVFMGKSRLHGYVGGVDIIGEDEAADFILNRGARLRPAAVDAALDAVESLFLPFSSDESPAAFSEPDEFPEPVVCVAELQQALLSSIDAAPIEDWMAFLHPEQARLASRSFNGPSRIRGAAGTGKTVVGLHRAAYLARTRPGRVLVTTLVGTLPVVLEQYMRRMAPDVADRVEFTGIHSFAAGILEDRGVPFNPDGPAADRTFDRAWADVGENGILSEIDPRPDYWRDEIISVIKGRGFTRFDQYAELARTGRRRGLNPEARYAVWQLYSEYELGLREKGVHDFADVINLAERSLRANPLVGYSAVIADEAQDLSVTMIRLLHALVGDAPDGLNLIGDSQQTIYPGGYKLGEANVSVSGRGVVMKRNYRNTAEIALFAGELLVDDDLPDAEPIEAPEPPDAEPVEAAPAEAPAPITRHGLRPRVSRFTSRSGHDRSLLQQVQLLLSNGMAGSDIAVLAQTNFVATEVLAALTAAGVSAVDLRDYDGRRSGAVTVGTIKRAKGLEFKQVLVARTSASLLETVWSSTDEAEAERRELERRELYVAMTRARDGVWVGVA
jgi:hypothetical protein